MKSSLNAKSITLRPAQPDDDEFLFRVYASTRAEELAALGWDAARLEAFLRMQSRTQQLAYRAKYPDADYQIIMLDHESVGRILVARTAEEINLTEITLLPEYRNAGIGTTLIRDLQREASKAGVPVHLRVLKTNPAARLYERLGFSPIDDKGFDIHMRWRG